jgi:competence protein ComEC
MNYRNPFPLFRVLLAFVAGIVTSSFTDYFLRVPVYLSGLLLGSVIFLVFFSGQLLNYANRWVPGIIILALHFLFGYQIALQKTGYHNPVHIVNIRHQPELIMGRVNEPLTEKEKSYSVVLKIIRIRDTSNWSSCKGNVMLYLQKDSLSALLQYGDILVLRAKLDSIPVPANPYQFSYKKYLANKGIYRSAFISSGSWILADRNRGSPIRAFANVIREKTKKILHKAIPDGDECAVVTALLIGAKDELDADMMQNFAAAGVLHILVVSGMHVGLIYLVLNALFGFLRKSLPARVSRAIVVVILMWLYSLITGFGPSVLRAAAMFSLIAAGNTLQRVTSIYNTLIASAFILLIVNPFLINDAGFELSYASVVGIIALQKSVYELFSFKWWIPDRLWSITAVTIAAQIGTFPLAIYYFRQFPVYFILANLIVIPLSSVIIYAGIVYLMISPVTVLCSWLAQFISAIARIMILTVSRIEELPLSTISGISITLIQCLFMYALIISLFLLRRNKKHNFIFISLIILFIISLTFYARNLKCQEQHRIIIYDIPGASAYDLIMDRSHVFIGDSSLINDKRKIDRFVKACWTGHLLKRSDTIILENKTGKRSKGIPDMNFYYNEDFIQFMDKRIVIIDKDFRKSHSWREKMKVDLIIVRQNADIAMNEINDLFDARYIVTDSSNSPWKIKKWKEGVNPSEKLVYSVFEKGAFILTW